MALTHAFDSQAPANHGDQRVVIDKVTLDSSYPTGGYPVTPASFGLTYLLYVVCSDPGTAATYVEFDSVASKLKAFVRTTGVEVANTTNLSAVVTNVLAIGK